MLDFQWLIGGEAGYGIMTTGLVFGKALTRLGLSVFDYVEYPSLIRGGHNAYYVRAGDEDIFSQKKPVDILVALNRETLDFHKNELSQNAFIIYDKENFEISLSDFSIKVNLCPVPLFEITQKAGADKLMVNMVAVGASVALVTDDPLILDGILEQLFEKKGNEVITINKNIAREGFQYCQKNYAAKSPFKVKALTQKNLFLSGSEAIALGAIRAGLKFAAIYPMTPINGIQTYLAAHGEEYGIIVKEPEDEIAGINMALGASYVGVRSLVATSGGGFALMTESLGLSAQSETPIVIIEGMRPGPATGLPTWTEQGDLRFVLHAPHGDFPKIVLAPGCPLEAFNFTLQAFNLADKYLLPVIILVDKYLCEGHATIESLKLKVKSEKFKIERGKILSDQELEQMADYERYKFTEDGISPRSFPGQKGGITMAGSDEHDERGLYNESSENRIKMMDKRFKKLETAAAAGEFSPPVLLGSPDAPLTILAFGSTQMPILEAMGWLLEEGIKVNFLPVAFLSPFSVQFSVGGF